MTHFYKGLFKTIFRSKLSILSNFNYFIYFNSKNGILYLQAKRKANGNGCAAGHGQWGPTSNGRNAKKKQRKLDPSYFQVYIMPDLIIKCKKAKKI
jgi:hypothetical protein